MRAWMLGVVAAALAVGAAGGCKGKEPANTAEAVAQAFADAMAKGDSQGAAALCDYVAEARRSNQDWDDIPSGQRGQIIGKLKASRAQELSGQASLFGAGMKAGIATASADAATVVVEGGPQGTVSVYLVRTDGRWGVSAFQAGQ